MPKTEMIENPAAKTEEEILKVARHRFHRAVEAERENRTQEEIDVLMALGDQWDPEEKRKRQNKRLMLTSNRLRTFINQVVNDARQNRPAIKISPVDSGADRDLADIRQGIIRHIEYLSDANVAYTKVGFKNAVRSGRGHWRITADWVPGQWVQELKIEPIEDAASVYLDCDTHSWDRSDAKWCFILRTWSHAEYEQEFNEKVAKESWDGGDFRSDWATSSTIITAEYWTREPYKRLKHLMPDGKELWDDELQEAKQRLEDTTANIPGQAVAAYEPLLSRTETLYKVKQRIINGVKILEESEWRGSIIPIIELTGEVEVYKGKRTIVSLIRFARHAQQTLNYMLTSLVELISIAPKAPWVGAVGQFETDKDHWKVANTELIPYLQYDIKEVNGVLVGPPQRNMQEPAIQAMMLALRQASDEIKATLGMFDASIGNRSNETSGVAIRNRQKESDTATFHFMDNLAYAQKLTGRILNELIPFYYDTAREVRIIGEDQTEKIIRVNMPKQVNGKTVIDNPLDVGRYDVTVSQGPSYDSRRQEAFDRMTEYARAWPKFLELFGDIIFRTSDMPGADELAERFKKTLPPGLLDEEDQGPIPPAVQAQMVQMQAALQKLQAANQELTQTIASKQIENESKERIAMLNGQIDLLKVEAQIQGQASLAAIRAEFQDIQRKLMQSAAPAMPPNNNEAPGAPQPSGPVSQPEGVQVP